MRPYAERLVTTIDDGTELHQDTRHVMENANRCTSAVSESGSEP